MKKYVIVIIIIVLVVLAAFSGCTGTKPGEADVTTGNGMDDIAKELVVSIDNGLEEIDTGLSKNAKVLSEKGLTREEAEATLTENLMDNPWAISSLVISKEGVVVTAAPKNYEEIVGTDLSWQSQVEKANSEQVPIVSDVFTMEEGFTGIYLPGVPAGFNESEKDELVKRVKNARDYAHANGKAEAVAAFNDPEGHFADGANYIFAYDNEGTTLALPHQPEMIGTSRFVFTDTYGVKIIQWEVSVAKQGGGFVYIHYFDPDTGDTRLKLCYVTPVNDQWFVGSGIYKENL